MLAEFSLPVLLNAGMEEALAKSFAEACAKIQAQSFQASGNHQHPWAAAAYLPCLQDDTHVCYGVFNGSKGEDIKHSADNLAAFGLARLSFDEAEVLMLATRPQFWRLGLALQILNALIAACVQRNIKSLFLEVAIDNAPARALYTRLGFSPVGLRPNYYSGDDSQRRDALVMRKNLS